MTRGIRLGRIGGVDIIADLSVLVVSAAVAWLLYVDIEISHPGTSPSVATVVAIFAGLGFVLSVLAHEGSHAVVARRRGLGVRRIRLLAFGGYTTIEGKPTGPADELFVSAAGPIVSIVISGILWLAAAGFGAISAAQSSLQFLAFANLFVAGFNLLPGFPLDGGRVLRSVVWAIKGDRIRATEVAVTSGRVFGWIVIGGATVYAFTGLDPWSLLWIILGWYLLRSAEVAGRRERLLVAVDGMVARDVMHPTPDPVPGEMLVGRVIELYQMGHRLRSQPVVVGGRIRGVLGESEIEMLSPARRLTSRASAAMSKIGPRDVVGIGMPLDALAARPPGKTGRLVVVDEGRAVGIIEGADLQSAVEGRK
ncbi:MAG: site-2 protease family protein [Actinomycetota bacterium]